MDIEITRPIDRQQWLRALNVKNQGNPLLREQMDEAESLIFAEAGPKAIYRIMAREDVKVSSSSLKRHLEGCHKAAVMGITLGQGVDALIRKTEITDMSMAVVMDSGASVLTEQLCDRFQEYIAAQTKGFITSRFSPGYGDFPLEAQEDIIGYIDGPRKIGLNITKDYLMVPRKSVTAVIGIARHPVKGSPATCRECVLKEKCTLRNEGKYCGN